MEHVFHKGHVAGGETLAVSVKIEQLEAAIGAIRSVRRLPDRHAIYAYDFGGSKATSNVAITAPQVNHPLPPPAVEQLVCDGQIRLGLMSA
jgi:hypothetical protein